MSSVQDEPRVLDPDSDEHWSPRDRPGCRRFVVATAEFGVNTLQRVGLTLEDVIRDEVEDYRSGLAYLEKHGIDPETEDDRAIWEDGHLLALVRPSAEDGPAIHLLGKEQALTAEEFRLLALVRQLGVAEASDRLDLAGPYRVILQAIHRLGPDGVEDLRAALSREKAS